MYKAYPKSIENSGLQLASLKQFRGLSTTQAGSGDVNQTQVVRSTHLQDGENLLDWESRIRQSGARIVVVVRGLGFISRFRRRMQRLQSLRLWRSWRSVGRGREREDEGFVRHVGWLTSAALHTKTRMASRIAISSLRATGGPRQPPQQRLDADHNEQMSHRLDDFGSPGVLAPWSPSPYQGRRLLRLINKVPPAQPHRQDCYSPRNWRRRRHEVPDLCIVNEESVVLVASTIVFTYVAKANSEHPQRLARCAHRRHQAAHCQNQCVTTGLFSLRRQVLLVAASVCNLGVSDGLRRRALYNLTDSGIIMQEAVLDRQKLDSDRQPWPSTRRICAI
ncbi:hypothetical protein DFP72DRAFT_852341 [Ephemerocybe angulata]|uniref:Uncharacterized protein n=1 Tax=Ephemerocybe angulata TaxID=980116 RepID=A0A8H6LZF1_9AGAR|nr:hypothetical protein DFP72DRAFT_852341 [Tulosesus angulatus]